MTRKRKPPLPAEDHTSLLRAIHDAPDDDTVRLAYADWLDERDLLPDRSWLIRSQINGQTGVSGDEMTDRAVRLWGRFAFRGDAYYFRGDAYHFRADVSSASSQSSWWADVTIPSARGSHYPEMRFHVVRGFVYRVQVGQHAFAKVCGRLLAAEPAIQCVEFFDCQPDEEEDGTAIVFRQGKGFDDRSGVLLRRYAGIANWRPKTAGIQFESTEDAYEWVSQQALIYAHRRRKIEFGW